MNNQILMKRIFACVLVFVTGMVYAQTAPLNNVYSENTQNDSAVALLISGSGVNSPVSAFAAAGNYEDFSGGLRFGTWALNAFVIPGLGSYVLMNDIWGGTSQLLMGILSDALIIGGVVYVISSIYGGFYSIPYDDYYGNYDYIKVDEQNILTGYIAIAVGGLLYTINGIYNIIRSATYHKPRTEIASLIDPTAWSFAALPARNGKIDKVLVSYTMRF